jgi:hypothetical protein
MICWDFMLACGTTLPFCALIVIAGVLLARSTHDTRSRKLPIIYHAAAQCQSALRASNGVLSRCDMHACTRIHAAPCDPQIGRIDQIP